jgi:hypothetical protein
MAIEGNYSTKQVFLLCALLHDFQQVTMPHVDAIKDANGKNGFL